MAKQKLNPLDQLSSPQYIKHCCNLLSAYGVKSITCEYDGYGDSGDFGNITLEILPQTEKINKAAENTTLPRKELYDHAGVPSRQSWDKFVDERRLEKNPIITPAMCDRLADHFFELLPGGWEINDGSYGEIHVDIATGAITVEHNERYTDVRSETFEF
jgi:hypothetical protein